MDIFLKHTFTYKGMLVWPSRSAIREMIKLGISLDDCKMMLEEGYPAPRRRAKGIIERWFDKRNKTYNIVVVQCYSGLHQQEIYLITHLGRFTKI